MAFLEFFQGTGKGHRKENRHIAVRQQLKIVTATCGTRISQLQSYWLPISHSGHLVMIMVREVVTRDQTP